MAIAKISDLTDAHDEYRTLYWELNEMQLCGVPATDPYYDRTFDRMNALVAFLGYTPTP